MEKPQFNLDEKPPILGEWRNMYILVLSMHAVVITLFYIFTQYYK